LGDVVQPLAVYIHVPFCTIKCGYCDFNVYAGMERLKPAYTEAVVSEVRGWSERLSASRVTSVFFGGGTPGEMPASSIAAILDAVLSTAVETADAIEVTIEANPGTTTAAAMADIRHAGVNRMSLGAQSFAAAELAFLDRIHSPEAIEASVQLARDAGFDNVGLDLIYGLPGQAMETWMRSLDKALALEPEHLSMYALTVEEGTPLDRRVSAETVMPMDGDDVAAMYESATKRLERTPLKQYEISNWAQPGFESRHNRVYWTDGDYLGLGAGAHGYLDGERFENEGHPRKYIQRLSESEGGPDRAISHRYQPDRTTAISDWLGLRLRLLEGFPAADFQARFGEDIDEALGSPLARAIASGVLGRDQGVLRLTQSGHLIHSEVVVNVMAYLQGNEQSGVRPSSNAI
jgi:putative oxygen-independent coproporphyrinogen III oxidase